jgi:hypothetical protein
LAVPHVATLMRLRADGAEVFAHVSPRDRNPAFLSAIVARVLRRFRVDRASWSRRRNQKHVAGAGTLSGLWRERADAFELWPVFYYFDKLLYYRLPLLRMLQQVPMKLDSDDLFLLVVVNNLKSFGEISLRLLFGVVGHGHYVGHGYYPLTSRLPQASSVSSRARFERRKQKPQP